MMERRPAIAVIAPSILTALGMKSILEKIIPMAEVEVFNDVHALEESGMERYFHFFTAAPLFVRHSALFRPYRRRVILLAGGSVPPELADMRRLNILRSEEELVRDIMHMHRSVHHDAHDPAPDASAAQGPVLSAREAEVLALIARGHINKEIAQRLGIGLTTVISHRRNLMEKLGIRSVSGLTLYAVTRGYVEADEL
ncbi:MULTISPECIES: LuxR C-terminal-related transcriptional regulator [unclassified Alistipes]|jgi:DNA-binding CsgD family transcriptional regulator|uniref:helix-turn-helix transcriptional regulator n=1 Tax=unclassified Alistipes TaxID=2608932 RepID=UPI0026881717|nr:LuxR C-terminal-related transcriptional regulator [Alistipes sp. Marseille-P5061]